MPDEWLQSINRHRITLWNSAPQLMRLLVDEIHLTTDNTGTAFPSMLSGDWIPLELARYQLMQHDRTLRNVFCMGGATEASIWSNGYPLPSAECGGLDEQWTSIPYGGYPIANQAMLIVNENMGLSRPFAIGEIVIGGIGVAHGYLGLDELTKAKFIDASVLGLGGERGVLYRTGW